MGLVIDWLGVGWVLALGWFGVCRYWLRIGLGLLEGWLGLFWSWLVLVWVWLDVCLVVLGVFVSGWLVGEIKRYQKMCP